MLGALLVLIGKETLLASIGPAMTLEAEEGGAKGAVQGNELVPSGVGEDSRKLRGITWA